MAPVNGNRRREPPDKRREGPTAGGGLANATAKLVQGKIFQRVKELRQAVKKGRQFEIRKLCRRVKEVEKRSANLTAVAAAAGGTPISASSRDGRGEGRRKGTTVNPDSKRGSEDPEDDKKVLGLATAVRRQPEKLKQKLAAMKVVAVDDVVKHACISAGLPECQAEDLVLQLRKYIERLAGGGLPQPETTVKVNYNHEEEYGGNPNAGPDGVADSGGEHNWAMERLVNTKCVEDELLLLRDLIADMQTDDEEVLEWIEAERLKGEKKRKIIDNEGIEGKAMEGEVRPKKVSCKREKVAKGDSRLSDAEGVDDPESRGLPCKNKAEQRRKKPKEAESGSDVEGMDREMAEGAIAKLQSATLARRLQKSQREALNSKVEEELGEEEEKGGEEESETSSGVISARDAGDSSESEDDGSSEQKGRSAEEHNDDGCEKDRSGEGQSEDEGDDFFCSSDDDKDDDVDDTDQEPRHKALGTRDHMCSQGVRSVNLRGRKLAVCAGDDNEMDLSRDREPAKCVMGKEQNRENGTGRTSERTLSMGRSGREERRKEPLGREGGGKANEPQGCKGGGKLKAQLEMKLKKRLHRMTKAGGNRLGQRERRRLAEMILGVKAWHLEETSMLVGQMQYRQPCRPTSGDHGSSMKVTKGNGQHAAAGLSHAQGFRGKTGGGSRSVTSERKGGRLEATSGRGRQARVRQKSQMVASGAKGGPHNSSKCNEHNTKDDLQKKGTGKLHPSWIAKIEQQKKAAQLNVASGKKIKFNDDDDDNDD